MTRHPFIDLLRDPPVRMLWYGLAGSAIGSQLYGVALIWLAIEIGGTDAGLVSAASYAAVLVTGLLAGLYVDRLPPRRAMIGLDLARAVATLLPVAVGLTVGLTLPVLALSAVLISALNAVFDPLLFASVPRIARSADRVQATNGLIDATVRLSRLAGPLLAGLLTPILPVLHLFTLNAFTFLGSALALHQLKGAIDPTAPVPVPASPLARMLQGFTVAGRDAVIRRILIANTIVLAAWSLGVVLGVPTLVAEHRPAGHPLGGLTAVGLILAAYGGADLLSNLVVSAHRPRRPWPFMHVGYLLLGAGLALLPLGLTLLPDPFGLPAAMLAGALAGIGGPMFFLPMQALVQTRLAGIELAGVLRLRISLVGAAMMTGTALGTLAFPLLGSVATLVLCGAVVALVGGVGLAADPLRDRPRVG